MQVLPLAAKVNAGREVVFSLGALAAGFLAVGCFVIWRISASLNKEDGTVGGWGQRLAAVATVLLAIPCMQRPRYTGK